MAISTAMSMSVTPRLMDAKLKGAGKSSELHVYKDRDHYLEDGDIRAEMLRHQRGVHGKGLRRAIRRRWPNKKGGPPRPAFFVSGRFGTDQRE